MPGRGLGGIRAVLAAAEIRQDRLHGAHVSLRGGRRNLAWSDLRVVVSTQPGEGEQRHDPAQIAGGQRAGKRHRRFTVDRLPLFHPGH